MESVPPSSSAHPTTWKFGYPIYHAESRAALRAWFEHNHDSTSGLWLCSWRNSANKPRCPYPDAVEEALCFGWIDSTAGILDDDRGVQLFTPRRAKSSWTRLNRQRVADMEKAGLMTGAGRRAVAIARANGWWTIYDQVEDLIEPAGLTAALAANDAAQRVWNEFPASARKAMLWWIVRAAREETAATRIATIVSKAARGERAQG